MQEPVKKSNVNPKWIKRADAIRQMKPAVKILIAAAIAALAVGLSFIGGTFDYVVLLGVLVFGFGIIAFAVNIIDSKAKGEYTSNWEAVQDAKKQRKKQEAREKQREPGTKE